MPRPRNPRPTTDQLVARLQVRFGRLWSAVERRRLYLAPDERSKDELLSAQYSELDLVMRQLGRLTGG